jgi:SPP1 gp7 family putative phage head morphogenesis protein
MSRYNLTQMTLRAKNPRRKSITIRDIRPPNIFASDLYRAAYAPVIALWNGAIDSIVNEYARTIGMMQDSPADIEAAIERAENSFALLAITITPALERYMVRVERWHRGKWRGAVLSATNVDIGTMIGAADVRQTLEAAINYNVSLVKDVSAEARRRMSAIIYDGLRNNKPAREVAKELRAAVELGKARSIRISSDQLSKLAATLADERRREAGIDSWIWLHSGKRNPRADHVARNGKVYSDKKPPPEMPGQLPFCGCRSQAVVNFD